MAAVEFKSTQARASVVRGFYESGRPIYSRFLGHRLETSDPEEIEFLVALCAAYPQEYQMVGGGFICKVCHKVCQSQFALDGHMRSHG